MNIYKNNKLLNIIKIIVAYIFLTNIVLAQEKNNTNSETSQSGALFPIAVVDMQKIVSQSLAAVKVREFIENKKKGFSDEIQKEEEALKIMQEELGSQRSILPPDEFSLLESNFRKRVENLQKMVAEKNQLLENILSNSVQVIQSAAIKIITEIGREKGLALTLDTSSVVIAANSINISKTVIELLNINLPEVDMDAIINKDK